MCHLGLRQRIRRWMNGYAKARLEDVASTGLPTAPADRGAGQEPTTMPTDRGKKKLRHANLIGDHPFEREVVSAAEPIYYG